MSSSTPKPCKNHNFKIWYTGVREVEYKCSKCLTLLTLSLTAVQTKYLNKKRNLNTNIHDLYHSFLVEFRDPNSYIKYKYQGTDLMTKVQEWVNKNKNKAYALRADDAMHRNKILVCIPHRNKFVFHGMTIFPIDQGNENSLAKSHFLFYYDMDALLNVIKKEQDISKAILKNQHKYLSRITKAEKKLFKLTPNQIKKALNNQNK